MEMTDSDGRPWAQTFGKIVREPIPEWLDRIGKALDEYDRTGEFPEGFGRPQHG